MVRFVVYNLNFVDIIWYDLSYIICILVDVTWYSLSYKNCHFGRCYRPISKMLADMHSVEINAAKTFANRIGPL